MKLLIILTLTLAAFGQSATMTLSGPATAAPGATITVALTATGAPSANTGAAAFQWTMPLPSGGYTATVAAGATATAGVKTLRCTADNSTCLLYGQNATIIGNGVLANYSLRIPATAAPGVVTLSLSGLVQASATGMGSFPVAGPSYTFTVADKRDIDGNGTVTQADVDLMLNEAFAFLTNPAACVHDQTADGKCDVVDVFLILLKVLGQVP